MSGVALSRVKVALWTVVLAPIWPLLLALLLRRHGGGGTLCANYASHSPLAEAWIGGIGYAILLYFVSLPFGNASIFDVHWSLLPTNVYVIHYALHPQQHPDSLRAILVFAAIWIWGMRLTGNWLKKGGLGFEDFRYLNYRSKMSPLTFQLFSLTALFIVQSCMVLAMTTPVWLAMRTDRPFGVLDVVAFAIVVCAVLFEWTADLQGMAFRERREAHRKRHPEDLEGNPPSHPRFPQQGLWKYSRHPNYFGEVCVWWGVYLFGVAASGEWINWTIVGPLTINGLFVGGSIKITEDHELSRKPEYADYQRRVSRLIPWWPQGD